MNGRDVLQKESERESERERERQRQSKESQEVQMRTSTQNQMCPFYQNFRTILTVIYLVLTGKILPPSASQGEKDFSAEKKTLMCKFGVYCVLHWSPSNITLS